MLTFNVLFHFTQKVAGRYMFDKTHSSINGSQLDNYYWTDDVNSWRTQHVRQDRQIDNSSDTDTETVGGDRAMTSLDDVIPPTAILLFPAAYTSVNRQTVGSRELLL